MSADTNLMPIAGAIDPVPVPRAVTPRADGRVELVGLSKDQIRAELVAAGLDERQAKLRAKQVWHWIYNRGVSDFGAMSDIAKPQRGWFAERFVISRPEVVEAQVSSDGTRKWLLRTHDGHDFEMVFIPDADRGTLCVSSQVGCTLNCRFCHTGTMQLVRNLEPAEIVGQVMLARDALGEWPSQPEGPDAHQHRDDGHGRAALQFRECARRAEDRHGRRRARPVAAADHAFDERCRADDGARGRRDRSQSRGVAARGDQGSARRDRAAQSQIRHRAIARSLRGLPRREQRTAHHVRICDAQGQERQRRRCARTRPADPQVQASGEGEPNPVQSVARSGVRMLDRRAHPRVQQHHLRGGHFGPGTHAARPRHRRGLRSVEDGGREKAKARGGA